MRRMAVKTCQRIVAPAPGLTQTSLRLKKCSRSPLHSGCGLSTSETAETAAAFRPEVVLKAASYAPLELIALLEGEVDAAADHGEVILRPVDYAPA